MESLETYFKKVPRGFPCIFVEEFSGSYFVRMPDPNGGGFMLIRIFGENIKVDTKTYAIIRNVDVI